MAEQELKWPVEKCENCNFDLSTVMPRARDKTGLSDDGLKTKMYTDYCPTCGKGYQVGIIDIPAPKEMAQIKEPIVLPSPDKDTGDDEPEEKEENKPGKPREPRPGEFWCTKCASIHKDTDKPKSIGLRHQRYKEA